MEEMSDYCPENSANCVYSSQTKSYRTELPSLRFNASIDPVMNAVINGKIFSFRYNLQTNFIHIVHRTPLMQFPDDVFITLTCTNGMVEVSFQSIGWSLRFKQNPERFADFHEHMLNSSFQDSCN